MFLNDSKPGELLYAARVRSTLPASKPLPLTDAELVWAIRNAQQVPLLNAAAALAYINANAATDDEWEQRLVAQRLNTYWGVAR